MRPVRHETLRYLQLRGVQVIPNVSEVARLENDGTDKRRLGFDAELELQHGLRDGQLAHLLGDQVQLPGRDADGLGGRIYIRLV